MTRLRLLRLLPFLLLGCRVAADTRICPHVVIKENRLSLNANEKIMVCGSPKGSSAWQRVPLSQAEYQLKVYLRNTGYIEPKFEQRNGELWVWLGPRLMVKQIVIRGADGILNADRLRHVVGHPLTSEMLDNITGWALSELRRLGFPCPKVDVKAQAWDQTVAVNVVSGTQAHVRRIVWDGRGDLDEGILQRYIATSPGELYNVRAGQLTTVRMFADGLFESALVQPACAGEFVDLTVKTSEGAPRFLRFGFGASTEELPFMDLSYKNARLDRQASSFYALLHASPVAQTMTVGSEVYTFSPWPTVFWGPRAKLGRESERKYEVVTSKIGVDLGRYWDMEGARWYGRGGPTWNYTNTVQGIGPSESYYLNWEALLQTASHDYELFVRDQFYGWTARFEYLGQRDRLGSSLNVDRFEVSGKYLWNIGGYAPPLFILASRLQAIAVNASAIDLSSRRALLPVEYRIFWGGDQTLRGFSRQELNNRGLGYLTGVYAGFELRLIEELPYKFQPFLLLDMAQLGEKRWTLDPTLYQSWGGGLRWPSPVGTLRASAARGRLANTTSSTLATNQDWVYFLSFGQEF